MGISRRCCAKSHKKKLPIGSFLLCYICSYDIRKASTVERAVESCPREGGGWYGYLRIPRVSRSVHRADYICKTIKEMTPPASTKPRRGISPLLGATARQCPFCISILPSVRRIVKIAVRFLHTKTALCDRKDTQSRFAVNTARGIMCVGTRNRIVLRCTGAGVSMPHAALCVSGQDARRLGRSSQYSFNTARGIMCVGTSYMLRQQHAAFCFNTTRGIMCVGTLDLNIGGSNVSMFQYHTWHYVCRDDVSRSPCPVRAEKAFWKDETAECGFTPTPEHFPFPSPL